MERQHNQQSTQNTTHIQGREQATDKLTKNKQLTIQQRCRNTRHQPWHTCMSAFRSASSCAGPSATGVGFIIRAVVNGHTCGTPTHHRHTGGTRRTMQCREAVIHRNHTVTSHVVSPRQAAPQHRHHAEHTSYIDGANKQWTHSPQTKNLPCSCGVPMAATDCRRTVIVRAAGHRSSSLHSSFVP